MRFSSRFRTLQFLALIAAVAALHSTTTASAQAENVGSSGDTAKKSEFPYRRLDFQVKASCVSCLRRVAKSLKSTRGVVNADVSIYYPHWAVVILDPSVTDEQKIIASVKKEKADVDKLFKQDLKEKPLIVVPRSDKPVRL